MSLNNLVQISRGAFRVLDASMNATAQNVANMETDGYTRRRVTLQQKGNFVDFVLGLIGQRTDVVAQVLEPEAHRQVAAELLGDLSHADVLARNAERACKQAGLALPGHPERVEPRHTFVGTMCGVFDLLMRQWALNAASTDTKTENE